MKNKRVQRSLQLLLCMVLLGVVLGGLLKLPADVLAKTDEAQPQKATALLTEKLTPKSLQPGEVSLTKTVTPVEGMVNQWDITLRVEGKTVPPQVDVVLTIDLSSSMKNNGRLGKAKAAARAFVKNFLKAPYNNRVALVTFGDSVEDHLFREDSWSSYFVDNSHKQLLLDQIDQLVIPESNKGVGTFTQAGIKRSSEILATSTNENRNLILISDGVPSYSYPLKAPYNTLAGMETFDYPGLFDKTTYQTIDHIPATGFNYDVSKRIGLGASYLSVAKTSEGFPNPPNNQTILFINHANQAISQAKIEKNKKTGSGQALIKTLYAIGVDMDLQSNNNEVVVGNETMRKIASTPENAYSASADDLAVILDQIAGELLSPLTEGVLIDPLGTGFVIDGNVTDANATNGQVTVDNTTAVETIRWEFNHLTTFVPNSEGTLYAELTYRVNATNRVLESGILDTNGLAVASETTALTYRNYQNLLSRKTADVAKVQPIIVRLKKQLFDEKGTAISNTTDAFSVEYGNDQYTTADQFTVCPEEQWLSTVHPWKAGKAYSVRENLADPALYATEIVVNGSLTTGTTATFTFPANGQAYTHQELVIKNRQLPQTKTVQLHNRQVVLNHNEELVVPTKAFYQSQLGTTAQTLAFTSGSTTKDTASTVTGALFTNYQLTLPNKQRNLLIKDLIPEYYSFYAYIATPTDEMLNTQHLSTNTAAFIQNASINLDYSTINEYWVSVFIKPKFGKDSLGHLEENPRAYSWDYRTNHFGR